MTIELEEGGVRAACRLVEGADNGPHDATPTVRRAPTHRAAARPDCALGTVGGIDVVGCGRQRRVEQSHSPLAPPGTALRAWLGQWPTA